MTITWQDQLSEQVPYFTRQYEWRFNRAAPEQRAEAVQEAMVATCIAYHSQYQAHGKLTASPHLIARRVASRIYRGASCLRRPGQRADMLDYSRRATGPRRDPDSLSAVADATEGPTDESCSITWTARAPDDVRSWASLASLGWCEGAICRTLRISRRRSDVIRDSLRHLWEDRS